MRSIFTVALSGKLRAECSGCERLAEIEENAVMAFTAIGGDDNNRISVILNRAYKVGRIDGRMGHKILIVFSHSELDKGVTRTGWPCSSIPTCGKG